MKEENSKAYKDFLKSHISKGKTDKVIQLLLKSTKDSGNYKLYNSVIIISNNYEKAVRELRLGISNNNYEVNKASLAILELIDKLDQEKEDNRMLKEIYLDLELNVKKHKRRKWMIGLLILSIAVILFLLGTNFILVFIIIIISIVLLYKLEIE